MHEVEKEEISQTKDQMGKFIAMPTAQDLADFTGLGKFYDNRNEVEERLKKERGEADPEDPEDGNGFWFTF
jgi:hypothetical protein